MKILLALFLTLSLSGCATVSNWYESYFMAKYDTSEHVLVNKITVYAGELKPLCDNHNQVKASAMALFELSTELRSFSSHLPDNQLTVKMVTDLHTMVSELHSRYQTNPTVNKTYCELKLKSISTAASTIQKAIAKRPRS